MVCLSPPDSPWFSAFTQLVPSKSFFASCALLLNPHSYFYMNHGFEKQWHRNIESASNLVLYNFAILQI